ncbi:MAG: hypothetical protein AABP62_03735 [Planctomycetota bacterium]
MSEQPREPQEQRPPINLVRWLVRTVVITTCVLLLIGGVCLMSRYMANRRLMTLAKPTNPSDGDVSFGWDGPQFDWLDRRIGSEHSFALLCQPSSLIIQGRNTHFTDASILSMLRESSGMKQIWIHGHDLPSGALEAIATRHPIEVLDIRLNEISQNDAKWLSRMAQLKQLNINQLDRESRANDWSWLKSLPKLESLGTTINGAVDRDVIALSECPSLKTLTLLGESFTDDALCRLGDLPQLEYLTLVGPQIHLRFPNGGMLPASLRGLELEKIAIADDSLAAIADLPQLNRVSISGGTVTDAGLEILARLPAIEELRLDGLKQITDDGLKALRSNKSLRLITVHNCGTTSQALIHLVSIPNWVDIGFERVHFIRESGAAVPALTPETVDDFIFQSRVMQEARDSARREILP